MARASDLQITLKMDAAEFDRRLRDSMTYLHDEMSKLSKQGLESMRAMKRMGEALAQEHTRFNAGPVLTAVAIVALASETQRPVSRRGFLFPWRRR